MPAAEEAVAGAPATAADDVAQVTVAMAQVAVAAGGADSSPCSSSDSDSDGDGDDDSKNRGSGAEAAAALASKPYSELQAMAKARGIRANTKKEVMVKALHEGGW